MGGLQVSAQMIKKEDTRPTDTATDGQIVGYWAGLSICGTRAWVVFHRIYNDGGALKSEYRFYGVSNGGDTVDIYLSGDVYFFNNRNPAYYDSKYRFNNSELRGTTVDNEDCQERLWPVTEAEWRDLSISG